MTDDRYERSTLIARKAARFDAWISAEIDNPARQNYQFINGAYPMYGARAEGAHVWDVDGNEYIDFNLGYGTIHLGHCHPAVLEAVFRELRMGHCLSPLWRETQATLCELICSIVPNAEQAFLMRTGSDASTGAIRLARLFTGRNRVVRWGYNGWHDWCTPRPGGVPNDTRAVVHELVYNDLSSLQSIFERHPGEIACVFMMPFELDMPEPGFLEGVRRIAHEHGALFILDEMRSGFRFALGGAQEFLGIDADLVTFSKALANGFPVSCIAGRADILKGLANTKMTATYFSATESMAAGIASLEILSETDAIQRSWLLGHEMIEGLRALNSRYGTPASIKGFPICPLLEFDGMDDESNRRAKIRFFSETARLGLFLHPSHHWYVCAAHTPKDIDVALKVCESAMASAMATI